MAMLPPTHKEFKLHGVCAFWTLPQIVPETLTPAVFTMANLEKHAPSPIRSKTAMRRALSACYGNDHRIEAVESFNGFAVLRKEELPGGELAFPAVMHATVARMANGNDRLFLSEQEAALSTPEQQIRAEFQVYKTSITSGTLGGALVSALWELQAVTLRPSGGFYWIPKKSLGAWTTLADGLAPAGCKLYTLSTGTDPKSVETLCDSLETKVRSEIAQLRKLLETGDRGERGLRSLQQKAGEIDRLVRAYEKILGTSPNAILAEAQAVSGEIAISMLSAG